MCVVFLLLNAHPRCRVVVASNRDEFLARPSREVHAWEDDAGDGDAVVIAGRDLRAGGTWLGVTQSGRFAVLTNYREVPREPSRAPGAPPPPSRGDLVTAYLRSSLPPRAFLEDLRASGAEEAYAGFNLVVGYVHTAEMWHWSNRGTGGGEPGGNPPTRLEDGVHGLSNALMDTPWPKVERGKERMAEMAARAAEAEVSSGASAEGADGGPDGLTPAETDFLLEEVLGDCALVEDPALLPSTGVSAKWEYGCSSTFVRAEVLAAATEGRVAPYGTRSCQVVCCGARGAAPTLTLVERYMRDDGTWVRHGVQTVVVPAREGLRPPPARQRITTFPR